MRLTVPRPTRVAAVVLGLLAASMTAAVEAAGTRWYTVEMLVFAATDPALASEVWPENPGEPDLSQSINLRANLGRDESLADDGTPHAFRRLPGEALGLHGERGRLQRSGSYRPLLHLGWRQPGFARDEAKDLYIGGAEGDRLRGTVRFWSGRYLHVEADLVYRDDLGRPFRLTEHRRLRLEETHYLDHPAFGILFRVSAYEAPAPIPAPAPAPIPASAPEPPGPGSPDRPAAPEPSGAAPRGDARPAPPAAGGGTR